jgi:hypothetical protein
MLCFQAKVILDGKRKLAPLLGARSTVLILSLGSALLMQLRLYTTKGKVTDVRTALDICFV